MRVRLIVKVGSGYVVNLDYVVDVVLLIYVSWQIVCMMLMVFNYKFVYVFVMVFLYYQLFEIFICNILVFFFFLLYN